MIDSKMTSKASRDSKIVIAGGGIAGLFAARTLLSFGFKHITILEKSDRLGGLLKSVSYKDPINDGNNYSFDYGTHFILKTGDINIDSILDQIICSEEFTSFESSLPEGQFINGQLYLESGCVNASLYSNEILEAIRKEVFELIDNEIEGQNLYQTLVSKYGTTAVSEIFVPIFNKFTGTSLHELANETETSFCASRIIIHNRNQSKKLKGASAWDNRIAFANYRDGQSPIKKYYPKVQGVQLLIDALVEQLIRNNVKILTSTTVDNYLLDHHLISKITLNNGTSLDTDIFISTLPPFIEAQSLKIEVPSSKPFIRPVSVVNIITDRKPVEGPFWITIYDDRFLSFRVTLYNNFSEFSGAYRLSIEILHDGNFKGLESDQKIIFKELQDMNILPEDANCLWSDHHIVPTGLPILKPGDMEIYDQQLNFINQQISNFHIISKHRNGKHGQIAILENVFHLIADIARIA